MKFRFLVFMLVFLLPVSAAWAANFLVDTAADAPDAIPGDGTCDTGGGVCSLRAAIMEANQSAGPHTINFAAAGVYSLTTAGHEDDAAAGDLDIKQEIFITSELGLGAREVVIDTGGGALKDRLIDVHSGGALILQGVTLRQGTANFANGSDGGAVRNNGGSVILDYVLVTGSRADGAGGGVANLSGNMSIVKSTIIYSTTYGDGGAVYNSDALIVENSTLSSNTSAGSGGGIYQSATGSLILRFSTIADNLADSDNTLDSGGGLYNGGVASVTHTIIGRNKIYADDGDAAQCSGSCSFGDTSANLVVAVPGLTPLMPLRPDPYFFSLDEYLVGIPVHGLLWDSSAVNGGHALGLGNCSTGNFFDGQVKDQSNIQRAAGSGSATGVQCDIGAFETEAGGADPNMSISVISTFDDINPNLLSTAYDLDITVATDASLGTAVDPIMMIDLPAGMEVVSIPAAWCWQDALQGGIRVTCEVPVDLAGVGNTFVFPTMQVQQVAAVGLVDLQFSVYGSGGRDLVPGDNIYTLGVDFGSSLAAANAEYITAWDDAAVVGTVTMTKMLPLASGYVGTLSYELIDNAANGSLTITDAATGAFDYMPTEGFSGIDSFTYRVLDDTTPSLPATVIVRVVEAEVGAPLLLNGYDSSLDRTPVTGALSVYLAEPGANGGPYTYSLVASSEVNGSVTVNADGSFTFTPSASGTGAGGFRFQVTDGIGKTSNIATFTVTLPASAASTGGSGGGGGSDGGGGGGGTLSTTLILSLALFLLALGVFRYNSVKPQRVRIERRKPWQK